MIKVTNVRQVYKESPNSILYGYADLQSNDGFIIYNVSLIKCAKGFLMTMPSYRGISKEGKKEWIS